MTIEQFHKQMNSNINRCKEKQIEEQELRMELEKEITIKTMEYKAEIQEIKNRQMQSKLEEKKHLQAEKDWQQFYKETLEEDAKDRQFIMKYNLENPDKKLLNDLP